MMDCQRNDADLLVKHTPVLLETIREYFLAKHMQSWGGAVALPPGCTWDSLAEKLEERFGQHIWHPCHWDVATPQNESNFLPQFTIDNGTRGCHTIVNGSA